MLLFDTLPHHANLYKNKQSGCCLLCGEKTAVNTLNNCEVALGQHRYDEHHDEDLQSTTNAVAKKLPPTTNFNADLDTT